MCSILSQSPINSNKYASYCDILHMLGSNQQRIMLYGYIDASSRVIIRNFSFHELQLWMLLYISGMIIQTLSVISEDTYTQTSVKL